MKTLCFISSLRPQRASANWRQVCELFERTALSVFNQTNPNFRFVVACHEPPILNRSFDERLEFITLDLPIPDATYATRDLDKRHKLMAALRRARELGADYVMSLDADDLVSNRLVDFVVSQPWADGWYVTRGYKYVYGSRWIEPSHAGFNLMCGSCNILSRRFFAFPDDPEREREVDRIWFIGGHAAFAELFSAKGANLQSIPFSAVTYVSHEGERMRDLNPQNARVPQDRRWLRRFAGWMLLKAHGVSGMRQLTADIRDEFAIGGGLAH